MRDLTLHALQARELSLAQIKQVLKSVADGVNAGAAKARIDVEKPLADVLAGMDDALLKVVRANRMALERLLDQGADFEDSTIRKALRDLDSLEDEFLTIVKAFRGGRNQAGQGAMGRRACAHCRRAAPMPAPRRRLSRRGSPERCTPPCAKSVTGPRS